MSNLRSVEVTADRIHLVASDGREVTVSRAKIEQEFGSKLGTVDERKRGTGDVVKALIVAALGEEQIGVEDIDLDFDPTNAKLPPTLITKSPSERQVADGSVRGGR